MTGGHALDVTEPQVLDHFVGQDAVVQRLRAAVESAFQSQRRLPHVLLVGDGCYGERLLASVLAREIGAPIHRCSGYEMTDPHTVGEILAEPKDREALIIENMDAMCTRAQVDVLRALTRRELTSSMPMAPDPQRTRIADFSLIATAETVRLLIKPVRQLFQLQLRLGPYQTDDIRLILRRCATQHHVVVELEAVDYLARCSMGRASAAVRLIESCRQLAAVSSSPVVTSGHARSSFELEGFFVVGPSCLQAHYLDRLKKVDGTMNLAALHETLDWQHHVLLQV